MRISDWSSDVCSSDLWGDAFEVLKQLKERMVPMPAIDANPPAKRNIKHEIRPIKSVDPSKLDSSRIRPAAPRPSQSTLQKLRKQAAAGNRRFDLDRTVYRSTTLATDPSNAHTALLFELSDDMSRLRIHAAKI